MGFVVAVAVVVEENPPKPVLVLPNVLVGVLNIFLTCTAID